MSSWPTHCAHGNSVSVSCDLCRQADLTPPQPNKQDWDQANNLKHLDLLNASQLRAAYRELSAYNFMYIRLYRETARERALEKGAVSTTHTFFQKVRAGSMNIYAKPGQRVVFAYPSNGYEHEQHTCAEHLEVDKTYTIQRTEVGDSSTGVWLQEVPNVRFNSVMFVDADEGK
jgi:hypothetical protein